MKVEQALEAGLSFAGVGLDLGPQFGLTVSF